MSGITPGWGSQWETLVTAINNYYGGGVGSDAYQKVITMLNSGEYTMSEMESILGQIPEFNTVYNANGELIRVSYKATSTATNTATTIAEQINSNAAAATKTQFETAQTITKTAGSDTVTISDTVTKYKAGVAEPAKAIATSAIGALIAAGVGITVGKTIDKALYEANPDFWDSIGMSGLNPDTWKTITAGDNSFGSTVFNLIFGIDPDTGNPQAYVDETTFAYMVAYMAQMGMLASNGYEQWDGDGPSTIVSPVISSDHTFYGNDVWGNPEKSYYVGSGYSDGTPIILGMTDKNNPNTDLKATSGIYDNRFFCLVSSKSPFDNMLLHAYNPATKNTISSTTTFYGNYTYDGKTVYYSETSTDGPTITDNIGTNGENFSDNKYGPLAWILQYGDFEPTGLPGVSSQAGATLPDLSSISDLSNIAAILALLQAQYPDLWNERIEISPDGDTVVKYIPIAFPTGGTGDQPTTGDAGQQNLEPDIEDDGENATDELIKTLIDLIQNPEENNGMEPDTDTPTKPTNPNPTDTGSGDTPTVIIPTGSAKSLFAIYNPNQSQLDSFGAWLWSSNFVDQLLKLFNDPMQAIIGLHKVFAQPILTTPDTIHVGYLDSGVSSNVVGNQYVTIDCGSVNLSEYFGNVFDYAPFTDVNIYLPFIGIQKLDTGDVMRSSIQVVYHVDVITGACLVEVKITRDLSGGTLYTYSGNCAVQYPISSGSYMGIVASIASIAGGVVGTIASGGALAPVAFGAVNGALNAHTKVQHSGNFSGNAGAMGIKKPYLIITRPQTAIAQMFPMFEGYPANESVTISQCSGFVKFESVHIENSTATESELNEIENILKNGIII